VIRRIYSLARPAKVASKSSILPSVSMPHWSLMEAEIRQKGIHVLLNALSPAATVEGDPVLLEQALFNLLRNAIESMRDTAPDQNNWLLRSGVLKVMPGSPLPTAAAASIPTWPDNCLTRCSPPSRKAWAWGWQSAVRWWKITAVA
jgi:hypothetical protein